MLKYSESIAAEIVIEPKVLQNGDICRIFLRIEFEINQDGHLKECHLNNK